MFYFIDTSALIKLYHEEKGSSVINKIFEDVTANICIARLAFTEFYSALYIKLRTREIADEAIVLNAIRIFEIDMQDVWVIQMHDKIFTEAQNLIKKYASASSLKALDALQLACADLVAQTQETTFVTADEKQKNIAVKMGFEVVFTADESTGASGPSL